MGDADVVIPFGYPASPATASRQLDGPPGRYASRTSCSRSVSDFRRFTKCETGVGIIPRAAYLRVCDRPAGATRLAPWSRQMAGSDAVVHAVRPISLAEDAQQIDPGLKITGIRQMSVHEAGNKET